MGKISEASKSIVDVADGCVVDVESGLLLGVPKSDGDVAALNEAVAAATTELLRVRGVARVQPTIRRGRGGPPLVPTWDRLGSNLRRRRAKA